MEVDEPRLTNEQIAALAGRVDRPIVLVGLMGVGKSAVGRKLAQVLDLPFADADDAIEEAAKMSIPEIFAAYGEAYFRDGERRVIARLIDQQLGGKPYVIATGGGAFIHPDTRRLILDKAVAVWLDSDLDTLIERVGRKTNRPLLQSGNPRDVLARLRREREPCYAEAPIKVISHNGPQSRTLHKVLKGIDAWL